LRKALQDAVQFLSNAWHAWNPELLSTSIGSTDPLFPLVDFERQKAAGLSFGLDYYIGNQLIYEEKHGAHALSEWCNECTGNYDWLYRLGSHLDHELHYRHGRGHLAAHILRTLENPPPACPTGSQNEPPPSMPEEYMVEADGFADAVASYRCYYLEGKRHMLRYTKREPPKWALALATFTPVTAPKPGV
jgi:hypothetical protein